jgi:tetratricopeptide (TPR) repeat protein
MKILNKIIRKSVVIILAFSLAALWGQTTGAVKGTIRDAKTEVPLQGVKITIVSSVSQTLIYELRSNKKGHFYRSGLAPGAYKATFEKDGYIPLGTSIKVNLSVTVEVEIKLEPVKSIVSDSANLIKRGRDLLNAGKYEEAIIKLSESISADPSNPVYYYYRAIAFERSENSEKAVEDYQKAVELKPDFTLPLSRAGIIFAKKGDFEKAVEFYKKATDLGHKDPETFYNYGGCLMNLGKNPEAKVVFEQLLTLDPNYSDAFYQLGIISIGLGETEKAKEFLQKFIEMDPENKSASLAKEILKSLN